eukprot:s6408_g1.t1
MASAHADPCDGVQARHAAPDPGGRRRQHDGDAEMCGKRSQLQRLHEIQAQMARGHSLSPAEAAQAEAAPSPDLDLVPPGPFPFPPSGPSFPRFPRPQAMGSLVAPGSEFLRHLRELEADLELAQSLKMRLPPALTQRIRRLPIRSGLLTEACRDRDPEEAAMAASLTLDLPPLFSLKDRSLASAQEPGGVRVRSRALGLGLELQMALEKEVRAPLRELQLVLEQVKARQDHLQNFLESRSAEVQSAEGSRYPSPSPVRSGRDRMPSPQPPQPASRSFQPVDTALDVRPNGAETFAPFRERCPRSGDKVASRRGESPPPQIRIPPEPITKQMVAARPQQESLMQAYLAFLKGEVDGLPPDPVPMQGLQGLAADMLTPNHGSPEAAASGPGIPKLPEVYRAAVTIIREHGWDALHGRDSSGPCWTALHWAAAEGRNDVCLLLLGCRADPNHEDEIGRIPAYYANLHGYADTAVLLHSSSRPEQDDTMERLSAASTGASALDRGTCASTWTWSPSVLHTVTPGQSTPRDVKKLVPEHSARTSALRARTSIPHSNFCYSNRVVYFAWCRGCGRYAVDSVAKAVDLRRRLAQSQILHGQATGEARAEGLRRARSEAAERRELYMDYEITRQMQEKAKLFQISQFEDRIADELAKRKAVQQREAMDRRRICDGSEELRQLKERLHMAKVNKERAHQLLEIQVRKERDRLIEHKFAENMANHVLEQAELEHKLVIEKDKQRQRVKSINQQQIAMKEAQRDEAMQEFGEDSVACCIGGEYQRERAEVDNLVAQIIDENERERKAKEEKQAESRQLLQNFLVEQQQRQIQKLAEEQEENERIEAYARMKRQQEEKLAAEKD